MFYLQLPLLDHPLSIFKNKLLKIKRQMWRRNGCAEVADRHDDEMFYSVHIGGVTILVLFLLLVLSKRQGLQ